MSQSLIHFNCWIVFHCENGFPGGSEVKASACNVGDLGPIPGSGRSPGEGNGSPLQYSCLENPMDGGVPLHGIPLCGYTTVVYSHWPVDGCLGYFQFEAFKNKANNILYMSVHFQLLYLFPRGAVTMFFSLSSLKWLHSLSHSSGGQKSEIRVLTGPFSFWRLWGSLSPFPGFRSSQLLAILAVWWLLTESLYCLPHLLWVSSFLVRP